MKLGEYGKSRVDLCLRPPLPATDPHDEEPLRRAGAAADGDANVELDELIDLSVCAAEEQARLSETGGGERLAELFADESLGTL
jgi:hypothetical protein